MDKEDVGDRLYMYHLRRSTDMYKQKGVTDTENNTVTKGKGGEGNKLEVTINRYTLLCTR